MRRTIAWTFAILFAGLAGLMSGGCSFPDLVLIDAGVDASTVDASTVDASTVDAPIVDAAASDAASSDAAVDAAASDATSAAW